MPETSTAGTIALAAAVVMLSLWLALVFLVQAPSGLVHVLYAAAVVLFARRVLLSAPASRP